jgi:uncharacterized protein
MATDVGKAVRRAVGSAGGAAFPLAAARGDRHGRGCLQRALRGGRRHHHRPLLVLWLGYGHKEATGTSLAAIIVIGVLAAAGHALYGNVDLWKGVLISIPAVAGGLLGVGGGVLFVPALVVFADQSQLSAEATSLVAIVLVSLVGTWRQRGYGNVRLREGLLVGILSPLGVLVGVVLANAVSERVLELSFAAVQLAFAWQLAKKAGLR